MGSSTPVVVQGTAVASPYDHNTQAQQQSTTARTDGAEGGEKQETRCRDPIFAVLLYGNVAAIAIVAIVYGAAAFTEAIDDSTSGYSYNGYIYATFILGALAIVLTGFALPIMMCIPELLIKASLIMMLVLSGVMMAFSFATGNILGGIFGAIFFAIFICYARAVWSRIPFASVNLLTACTAIRKNAGVIFVAYFFVAIAFGWTMLWAVSLMGLWEEVVTVEAQVGNAKIHRRAKLMKSPSSRHFHFSMGLLLLFLVLLLFLARGVQIVPYHA